MDENILKLATLLTPIVTTLGLAYIGYLTNRANMNALRAQEQAQVSAMRAERATKEVKETLAVASTETADKLSSLTLTADKTHALVNSAMGEQLELNAVLARRVAALTGDAEDSVRADAATNKYADHQAKQATADRPFPAPG